MIQPPKLSPSGVFLCHFNKIVMKNERGFKGVWIPREIWLMKDLNANERCLLSEIDSLDNEDGCTAGNEYFADFFSISEKTVTRAIQKMEGLKLIVTKYIPTQKGKRRIIKSNVNAFVARDKMSRGQETNSPDINTIEHNINNKEAYRLSMENGNEKYLSQKQESCRAIFNAHTFTIQNTQKNRGVPLPLEDLFSSWWAEYFHAPFNDERHLINSVRKHIEALSRSKRRPQPKPEPINTASVKTLNEL